jgi:hypothetical protein
MILLLSLMMAVPVRIRFMTLVRGMPMVMTFRAMNMRVAMAVIMLMIGVVVMVLVVMGMVAGQMLMSDLPFTDEGVDFTNDGSKHIRLIWKISCPLHNQWILQSWEESFWRIHPQCRK